MVAWRAYYEDGSTFDGDPAKAPERGVLVIAFADPEVGRYLLSRCDFYWWQRDRWWGGDVFGLWDYLCRPGWKRILFGRSVPGDRWNEVMLAAETDPDLPPKTARDKREGWHP